MKATSEVYKKDTLLVSRTAETEEENPLLTRYLYEFRYFFLKSRYLFFIRKRLTAVGSFVNNVRFSEFRCTF